MHSTTNNSQLGRLTPVQLQALRHVETLALRQRSRAREALAELLRTSRSTERALDAALRSIRDHARVVLHFHPDRLNREGESVAASLARDGMYRSQFETGLSSGSLTAYAGGDRDTWERRLFGGAYQTADLPPADRPKYGALELIRHADGPAPRFGSCFLILNRDIAERCSYTFCGSQSPQALEHSGTRNCLECTMLPLLEAVTRGADVLGVSGYTLADFLTRITRELSEACEYPGRRRIGRSLDSFIEVQVHGSVELGADAEWLIADPSYRRTPSGELFKKICTRYALKLAWHPGFILAVGAVPSDFRGPAMPDLARRIADDGILDVAKIGAAAVSLRRQPELWSDWAPPGETLQHLKQLWHVLVQYGTPVDAA